MEFEYTGENKEASKLEVGDFITLTGNIDKVSEVEEAFPVGGNRIAIRTADGAGKIVMPTRIFRLYV